MVQTVENKRKLDAILEAFGDYIRGQDFFDIVYSEKVGYVRILARNLEDEGPERMDTPEKLLDSLFNDIINDVLFSPDNPNQTHEHLILSEYEETESRRRITAILETMEDEDKARYLDFLDSYIKAYQEDGAKRRWQYGE